MLRQRQEFSPAAVPYGLNLGQPTISRLNFFSTYYRLWRWWMDEDLELDRTGGVMLGL